MGRLLLILLSLLLPHLSSAKGEISIESGLRRDTPWGHLGHNEAHSLRLLISFLGQSSVGATLLSEAKLKAAEKGQLLTDVIRGSNGSLTDTTLVRKFSPHRPDQVLYETESVVYLNRDLHLVDAVLDLAHELTHYVYRRPFNPYQSHFKFKDFVVSTVEGRGGEVDAFLVECRVMDQLFPRNIRQREKCRQVESGRKKYSKKIAIQKFYQMGRNLHSFKGQMKKYGIEQKEFPFISGEKPEFISSAYGLPYPVAATQEYLNIMVRACGNDRKRLTMMSAREKGREPASDYRESVVKLRTSYDQRCLSFTPPLSDPGEGN